MYEMKHPAERRFDLTGKRFGRLVVQFKAGKKLWICKCDCGATTRPIMSQSLRRGNTRSCGCLQREAAKKSKNATHGMSRTTEYTIWQMMKRRCYDPTQINYPIYGGRGIRVCGHWRDSFENFFSDMGKRPSNYHSIERIDNSSDYRPDNCCWATRKDQARNTRRNRLIAMRGVTKALCEWSEQTGIKRTTIAARLDRGLSPEMALA